MKIEVKKLSKEELNKIGAFNWPVWEKEASEFDWFYDDKESCYIIAGVVDVKTAEGITSFKSGDFVVFPKDLSCTWKIKKAVKKHYKFG